MMDGPCQHYCCVARFLFINRMDNLSAGFDTLGADINKAKNAGKLENTQGVVEQKLPELTLDMSDEQIVDLTDSWKKKWDESDVKSSADQKGKDNENYYLGKQFNGPASPAGDRPDVDNLIFESTETYLPQVTRRNPEPMVTLDNSEEPDPKKLKFVEKVKNRLGDLGDKNKIRLKLKKGARFWSLYLIGIGKIGWDLKKDIPSVSILRPHKVILDPDAVIDEDGYHGEYVGEYRKMKASSILKIIEGEENYDSSKKAITDLVGEKMGTKVQFIEWWTEEYMCWQMNKIVLLKKKNPHWNYDKEENVETVDEYGRSLTVAEEKKGINHFETPRLPYTFLVVFNLGDQPVDNTSLIGQNLANQDRINKRNRQINKNVDKMNGGMVISLARAGLDQNKAKTATNALQKGGTIAIPDGTPRDAVDTYNTPGLPSDVYNDLVDTRSRMRDIFGTRGSTPAGVESETTVRGKIISRGLDTDRIGGGVSEYLEQFADDIYNWFCQMLYVYDSHFQFVNGAVPPKIVISVKEGSLLPKDSTTMANQAIELATAGKMSLIDMYRRLEYPNPEELAANAWLQENAPELLYANNPLVQQAIQMKQAAAAGAGAKPPSESISFKDLPPDGQAQMAAKVGINLQPAAIAANEAESPTKEETAKNDISSKSVLAEVPTG